MVFALKHIPKLRYQKKMYLVTIPFRCSDWDETDLCYQYCLGSFKQWLNKMSVNGTWAVGVVIAATAWYLETDIWVTTALNNPAHPWTISPHAMNGVPSAEEDSIHLVNIRDVHFQSIHHMDLPLLIPTRNEPRRVPPTQVSILS